MITESKLHRYQRVFVLREFEHKTLQKVASEFGVTRERVRQLEVYGKKYFKKYPHLAPNYHEVTVKITRNDNKYSYKLNKGFKDCEGAGQVDMSYISKRIKFYLKEGV